MRKEKKRLFCAAAAASLTVLCAALAHGAEAPAARELAIIGRGEVSGQNGSLTVPYTLMNLSWEDADVCAVTAAYDGNGALSNVRMDDLTLPAAGARKGEFSIETDNANAEVKTFFLKDIDSLEPLCEPLIWNEEQKEPAAIRIEGERYDGASSTAALQTAPEANMTGGAFAHLTVAKYSAGEPYNIVYSIDCETAGVYELKAVTSNLWSGYSAGYTVSVNGAAGLACSEAEETRPKLTVENSNYNGIFSEYSFGIYALGKGRNTVTVSVDRKNWLSDGCTFYIDYLEFAPVTAGSESFCVRADGAPLNIFEENEKIRFKIIPNAPSYEDETFSYTLTDYFGGKTDGEATLTAGAPFAGIEKELPTGWYKLTVSRGGKSETHSLAVVPTASERDGAAYSPFAIDLVSAQQQNIESSWGKTEFRVGNYFNRQRAYARSAALAGAGWVRERMLWREAKNSAGASYNFTTLRGASEQIKNAGLNIINTFAEAPDWARRTSALNSLPKSPRDVYDYVSGAIKDDAGEYVDVWEVWNEQDAATFARESADWYAAMFKAAAIAAANSKRKPFVTFGGLSSSLSSSGAQAQYIDLMFRNDVMKYADIYNYHTHKTYSVTSGSLTPQTSMIESHKLASSLYNADDKPVWVTESGLRLRLSAGSMTEAEERQQARYLARAFLEETANGVDKQFLFLGMPFLEGTDSGMADFGIFNENDEPRRSYAAQAVMSKLLEGASYLGEVHSLPSGAKGYAMQKGDDVIEVLWSDSGATASIPTSEAIERYDLMGRRSSARPSGGNINITLSADPIYIVFDKNSVSNYYPAPREYREPQKTELTDAEKLVVLTEFPVRDDAADRERGYSLSTSEENKITVSVYNFAGKDMSGTLRVIPEDDAFDAALSQSELTVPANGVGTVTLTLTSNDRTAFGASYDVRLTGEFAASGERAGEISAYTALVRFDRGAGAMTETPFSGTESVSRWMTETKTPGLSDKKSESDGGVRFDISLSSGGQVYIYPYVYLYTQSLADYDGISFSVYCDREVANTANNCYSVQIWKPGGNESKFAIPQGSIPIKKGWNDYSVTWEQLRRFTNPSVTLADMSNIRDFRHVSIGMITTQAQMSYTVKNVKFFKTKQADEKTPLPEFADASASRDAGNVTFTATVPQGVDGVRVLYDGADMEYTQNGGKISLNITNAADGPHELLIVGYTPTGRAIYKKTDI